MPVSGPFAGQYRTASSYSRAKDNDQPPLGLLNHHSLMSKVSPVLICGSWKTVTLYISFDTALPSRKENLPCLLEPFPSCLHFLTRILLFAVWGLWHAQCAFVYLARGKAFESMKGICSKLCKMAENMPCSSCSSTSSSIPEMIKNCIIPVHEEIVQH